MASKTAGLGRVYKQGHLYVSACRRARAASEGCGEQVDDLSCSIALRALHNLSITQKRNTFDQGSYMRNLQS